MTLAFFNANALSVQNHIRQIAIITKKEKTLKATENLAKE